MSESFAALFEESLQRSEMRAGEVITAEVVRIEHSFVVVNAGLKSEAYVPIDEFKNDKGEIEVQVGDFVSVAIDAIENGYGDTILSRDKAKRLASWLALENSLESGQFVTGTVNGKVKGGLTVLVKTATSKNYLLAPRSARNVRFVETNFATRKGSEIN
jgi:small subunit ribosomal protein S1